MRTALAADHHCISATLGGSPEFILLDGKRQYRVSCKEKIPLFLQKHQIDILICNGIGNCMLDLLMSMKIKVIAGVRGNLEEVIAEFQAGTLRPGERYSCADHGRTCGECSGSF